MIFTILVSCTLFTMRYWNENQCVKDSNCIQLKGEDWYCDLSARTPGTCQQMNEDLVDTANTDSGILPTLTLGIQLLRDHVALILLT